MVNDGGFKHFLFSSPIWGRFPMWLIFSDGLVQPPTRCICHHFDLNKHPNHRPQQKSKKKSHPEPTATLRWMRIIVFTYTQRFMVFLGTPRGIISKVSIFRSRWRPSCFAWLKDLHCFLISACWQHGRSIFRCLDDFKVYKCSVSSTSICKFCIVLCYTWKVSLIILDPCLSILANSWRNRWCSGRQFRLKKTSNVKLFLFQPCLGCHNWQCFRYGCNITLKPTPLVVLIVLFS